MTEHHESLEEHGVSHNLMESKTSQLDDALSAELETAFHETTFDVRLKDVARIASSYNAIDLAYAASHLPPHARFVLYNNLPDLDKKIVFMINTDNATRWAVLRHFSDEEIKTLIEKMPTDEAVWILDDLPERKYRRVLELLDPKKRLMIQELEKHSRDSAGRLMTNEFFAFPMETTIAQAANFIRNNPGIDMTRRIFVLNEKGELIGFVPARNLIVNPPHLSLHQVMREAEYTVDPDVSREEVVDLVERYKIPALPVVDKENYLIGVITYEDVVEAIEDIADETIGLMAGTAEDLSEYDHVWKRFLSRAPWLLVTLFAGLISATVLSYFQILNPALLTLIIFFIPLINGMSGNVGVQCSTVLVRSMAIGILTAGKRGEAAMKEIRIGLLTGILFGCLCGTIIYLLSYYQISEFSGNPLQLGVTVAAGVLGASLTATTLGVVSPFFFARIRVDPALASGPIVTAFNDIMSMIMFFLISGFIQALFFS